MLEINNKKAILLTQEKIRILRDVAYNENDIRIQNALIDNDDVSKQNAVKYRNYLRDLPTIAENKTNEELLEILDKGIIEYDTFITKIE